MQTIAVDYISKLTTLQQLRLGFAREEQVHLCQLTTLTNLQLLEIDDCDDDIIFELSKKLTCLSVILLSTGNQYTRDNLSLAYDHQLLLLD
jgi:hypothetical protein